MTASLSPCDSWPVTLLFADFQQGSHLFVPAVVSTVQAARAENEKAQGALKVTLPGPQGVSRAGDTHL